MKLFASKAFPGEMRLLFSVYGFDYGKSNWLTVFTIDDWRIVRKAEWR
jgi:hypothetical protein